MPNDPNSTIDPTITVTPARSQEDDRPSTPPNDPSRIVNAQLSTPVTNFYASSVHSSGCVDRDARIHAMHNEISGVVAGPYSGTIFLDRYMKEPTEGFNLGTAQSITTFKTEMKKLEGKKVESHMYKPWVETMQAVCPNMVVVDTHDNPAQDFDGKEVKPDASLYSKGSYQPGRDAIQDIKKSEMMIEFKVGESDDPFEDNLEKPIQRKGQKPEETLGQITLYATAHAAAQYRTHIFSALVFPKYMRLLRWDRSGVVVTERLNWDSEVVYLFFRRFNHATREARGIDTTVNVNPTTRLAAAIRRELRCEAHELLISMTINKDTYFACEKNIYARISSPIGRSTRTFAAYRERDGKVFFLKDTWRIKRKGLIPEHEIYKKLHKAGVPNIPEFIDAGDVEEQITLTQEWNKDNIVEPHRTTPRFLRTLQHYRLVLEKMDASLEAASTAKQLVSIVRDATIAHRHAHGDAKILHRDISVTNIMMKQVNGVMKGFLCDWDLSKDLSAEIADPDTDGSTLERTGTWQFMAIRLLKTDPDAPPPVPDRLDDEESFYHVLVWMVLRYGKHTLSAAALSDMIYEIFEHSFKDREKRVLGQARLSFLRNEGYLASVRVANQGLISTLESLRKVLQYRYPAPPLEKPALDGWEDDVESPASQQTPIDTSKQERALKIVENGGWVTKILNNLLNNPAADWASDGELKAHEIVDPRVQLNPAKRRSGGDITSQVQSESSSRSKRQRKEHAQDAAGSIQSAAGNQDEGNASEDDEEDMDVDVDNGKDGDYQPPGRKSKRRA